MRKRIKKAQPGIKQDFVHPNPKKRSINEGISKSLSISDTTGYSAGRKRFPITSTSYNKDGTVGEVSQGEVGRGAVRRMVKKPKSKSAILFYDELNKKSRTGSKIKKSTSKKMVMKDGGKMAKDGKWIQKAINPKHKGYCTPMTKKTCTPKRKALAMTLKKMAKSKKSK